MADSAHRRRRFLEDLDADDAGAHRAWPRRRFAADAGGAAVSRSPMPARAMPSIGRSMRGKVAGEIEALGFDDDLCRKRRARPREPICAGRILGPGAQFPEPGAARRPETSLPATWRLLSLTACQRRRFIARSAAARCVQALYLSALAGPSRRSSSRARRVSPWATRSASCSAPAPSSCWSVSGRACRRRQPRHLSDLRPTGRPQRRRAQLYLQCARRGPEPRSRGVQAGVAG